MAKSQKELHEEYKKRGGVKSFAKFREASLERAKKKKGATATATKKVNKAKKLVSGKLRSGLRKDIKKKYSI